MDALLDAPEQIESIFNYIVAIGLVFQIIFIYVTLAHTPREMSTYRFTMMNTVCWSMLIVIHVGIFVRPVTFLPLPVCLITGPAKYLGAFYGGHFQVLVGLILLVNKSTAYLLCIITNFCAFKFPVLIRGMRLRDGATIYVATHIGLSGLLVGSAYASGLFTSEIKMTEDMLKDEIEIYWPQKYKSLQKLINSSLIIGATKQSLHCYYTLVYLIIIFLEMFFCIGSMIYSAIFLYLSIQTDKSSHGRTFKKRILTMVVIRTIIPNLTFNFPAFFGVYVVQFDRDDTSAFVVQSCLFIILFSPAICCMGTILGLRPYRRAVLSALKLKFSRSSDSETERTSESQSKHHPSYSLRNSTVYTTGTMFSNTEGPVDFHNNRI